MKRKSPDSFKIMQGKIEKARSLKQLAAIIAGNIQMIECLSEERLSVHQASVTKRYVELRGER